MNWYYKGEVVDETFVPPEGAVGFVYKITKYKQPYKGVAFDFVNKEYIGKKQLSMATKKKVGKREQAKQLEETGDKRRVKKIVRGSKTSNWMQYWGSCKELIEDHKNSPELFKREILQFAYTKKELSYLETKYQFQYSVLEIDSYNNHIQNWYRGDIIKPTKTEQ